MKAMNPAILIHSILVPTMTEAFSITSSFTGTPVSHQQQVSSYAWSMYNDDKEGLSEQPADHNAWSVLATTERWISDTLKSSNSASGNINNPYARKEVSYVCENQRSSPMVISNMFKWLKEARKQGEQHRDAEVTRADEQGSSYNPSTLRQTQVVVIPSNPEFETFSIFDDLLQAVNQARRNARDFVTDLANDDEDEEHLWSIGINCAHLHPNYGDPTPEQELATLRAEEEEGEVDVNLQAYQQARLAARRSPYPSVVIEVRASPAPSMGEQAPPPSSGSTESNEGPVSVADIQQLEALFGKSAAKKDDPEASFWDQVGSQIEEVSSVTPLRLAEEWVALQGDASTTAAFTESGTAHVDSAYQFVFANVAMLHEQEQPETTSMYYIVLPNFLSSAATSFEKFSTSVMELLDVVPSTRGRFTLSTLHPEHVDAACRSPCPILTLRRT